VKVTQAPKLTERSWLATSPKMHGCSGGVPGSAEALRHRVNFDADAPGQESRNLALARNARKTLSNAGEKAAALLFPASGSKR
jgi:hypothetical protein